MILKKVFKKKDMNFGDKFLVDHLTMEFTMREPYMLEGLVILENIYD